MASVWHRSIIEDGPPAYASVVGILGVLLTLGGGAACSEQCCAPVLAPDSAALSVLLVGNSLTYYNDLPEMLSVLLEEAEMGPVHVSSSSFPNYGLQDHWADSRTRDAIALGGWDYVALQQGPSATEGRPSLLFYSTLFDDEIRAAGAVPALYMVWPASSRLFDFDGVSDSYATAADSINGVLFPAGEAWRAVWSRDPEAELYGPDGFHPSVLGSYVAALTIADRLIGPALDPTYVIRTSSVEASLGQELGELLLEAVREANAAFP